MRQVLFEFVDHDWFPGEVRQAATDLLRLSWEQGNTASAVVRRLRPVLEATGSRSIVDFGSGSGGPAIVVYRELIRDGFAIKITLSDRFPNLEAFRVAETRTNGGIGYISHSVDPARTPLPGDGVRTMFATLHHFRPNEVSRILQDAVEARQPVAMFDLTPGKLPPMPMLLLTTPLGVLLATPFLRPLRPARLVLTYLLPVIPLFMLWDGLMSALRLYTVEELRGIVEGLDSTDYHWEIGTEPGLQGLTYLIGYPNGPVTDDQETGRAGGRN